MKNDWEWKAISIIMILTAIGLTVCVGFFWFDPLQTLGEKIFASFWGLIVVSYTAWVVTQIWPRDPTNAD